MKIGGLILLSLLISGCFSSDHIFHGSHRRSGTSETQLTSAVLNEANEFFSYHGHPIHPKLIQEFEYWISDLNPVTMAVDVSAAFDSNEYADEVHQDEYISFEDAECVFGYKHISCDKAGVHELQIIESGGGSLSISSMMWVKFEIWQALNSEGQEYDQLIMRLIRIE